MTLSLRPRSASPLREEMGEMERFIDTAFSNLMPFRLNWRRLTSPEAGFVVPAMCMWEGDDRFIVELEIPGVKKNDVDISVTGNTLSVRGERKPPEGVREEQYEGCEFRFGKFHRTIDMPAEVNAEHIKAVHADGVLEIQLPKVNKSIPIKVQVKAK